MSSQYEPVPDVFVDYAQAQHGNKFNHIQPCPYCGEDTQRFFSSLHGSWVCTKCGMTDKQYLPIIAHNQGWCFPIIVNGNGMNECLHCGKQWEWEGV
jgi:ribosomal protein S27AE